MAPGGSWAGPLESAESTLLLPSLGLGKHQREAEGNNLEPLTCWCCPGLCFQPVDPLGHTCPGCPVLSHEILTSTAVRYHLKASSSLPAATDAITAY